MRLIINHRLRALDMKPKFFGYDIINSRIIDLRFVIIGRIDT